MASPAHRIERGLTLRNLLTLTCSFLALSTAGANADNFNRISSFPVIKNMSAGEDASRESSPEIIDATADGMTLVYTDSPLKAVGFVVEALKGPPGKREMTRAIKVS